MLSFPFIAFWFLQVSLGYIFKLICNQKQCCWFLKLQLKLQLKQKIRQVVGEDNIYTSALPMMKLQAVHQNKCSSASVLYQSIYTYGAKPVR